MKHSVTTRIASRSVPLAFAVLLGMAPGAFAQGLSGNPTGPVVPSAPREKPKPVPPPAVPGAASDEDRTAKPDRPPSDLAPTEALFDAINRGDIASARDAINRGADLGGRNILGMSPTELSVDLGRNDITFLLLSLRAPNIENPRPATATAAAKPPRGSKTAAAARLDRQQQANARLASSNQDSAGDDSAPAAPAPAFATSARRPAAAPSAPLAPVASGGTGTPIPQMGFLGFGGTQR